MGKKRRGSRDGSIYKRRDGRWVGVVEVGIVGGKRKRKPFYGATRAEVRKKLDAAKVDHDRGIPLPNEKVTLKAHLDAWLAWTKQRVKPTTYASYSTLVKIHVEPVIGSVPLAHLTADHIQHLLVLLLDKKEGKGLSRRRVQMVHVLLKMALKSAVKQHKVARNVAIEVEGIRPEHREIQALTEEEAKTLIDKIQGEELGPVIIAAIGLGLRQGELLGLRWAKVDLDEGFVDVVEQVQRHEGELCFVPPKTARARRRVGIPRIVADALRTQRLRQDALKSEAGEKWKDHDLVFTTPLGTPLDGRNVYRRFQKILSDAGIERRPFHALRHSAASLMLAKGVHLKLVSEILGHSTISITADIYGHVTDAHKAEAARRLDGVFEVPAEPVAVSDGCQEAQQAGSRA